MQGRIMWRAALIATAACAGNSVEAQGDAQPQPQAESAIEYDLPSQDLGDTLLAIAHLSGRDVLFTPDAVRGRKAPAIKGRLSFDRAIRDAVAGSSLEVEYRAGAALIRERTNDSATARNGGAAAASTITITGTRIRGAGSASPVTVTTRGDLEQAGISDLADFTRILPQNYGGGQNRGIAGGGEQGGQANVSNSATLNLRGLGPDATLTLINGHRLAYDSLDQGIDISAIPLSAIDRIEVVSDGASALYGSDAVAGVANIILRRDFDGLETSVRGGAATDGGDVQQEYSLVGGKRWSSGGFMVALDRSSATPIYASERDYARSVDPSLTLTDGNRQLSAVVAFHQQIVPGLSVELDGNAMNRRSLMQNPFSPASDVHVSGIIDRVHVTSYALAPTLRADLGAWQAALSATGSDSRTFIDASTYTSAVERRSHLLYEDNLKGVEATAEGPLFALPGGAARLALGGGARTLWLHDRYLNVTASPAVTVHNFTERRAVQFAYGELSLPLAGSDLHLPLIHSLTVTAALRYEHWNRIAAVTTPKLGLVYRPIADLTLRATWGKSFKIPTLYEINQPETGGLYPSFYFTPPPQPAGSPVLIITGSAPNLKPERSTSWSATAELKPRIAAGLDVRATYFHIDYRDRIATPLTTPLTALGNPLYDSLITYNPATAEVNAIVASLPGGLYNLTAAAFDPSAVGAIIDTSARNTERQRIHGLDLNADYRLKLGADSRLLLTGSASYLDSAQQLVAGQALLPLAGTIFNPPHWHGRGGAVWDGKHSSLSGFVNYIGPTVDNTFTTAQTVAAFVTVDLSASVRSAARSGLLRNVELRLSALNVLDQKPHPVRNQFPEAAPYDSTNESPVGRFIGASLRKQW